jgi:hypothetical protein
VKIFQPIRGWHFVECSLSEKKSLLLLEGWRPLIERFAVVLYFSHSSADHHTNNRWGCEVCIQLKKKHVPHHVVFSISQGHLGAPTPLLTATRTLTARDACHEQQPSRRRIQPRLTSTPLGGADPLTASARSRCSRCPHAARMKTACISWLPYHVGLAPSCG